MIILCTGMYRSGSTWSFNVVKSIVQENDPNATMYSDFTKSIQKTIEKKIKQFDNIVLKCHDLDEFGKSLVRHNCVKVIYTYRNPMEAITSGMQIFNKKFKDALTMVKNSFELLQFQKKYENVCLIPYNEITNDSFLTVKKLSKHIDINLDEEKLKKIDAIFQRKKMKELVNGISKEVNSIVDIDHTFYNKINLFHRNHIREDDALPWEEYLTQDQKEEIRKTLKSYLDENGNIVI